MPSFHYEFRVTPLPVEDYEQFNYYRIEQVLRKLVLTTRDEDWEFGHLTISGAKIKQRVEKGELQINMVHGDVNYLS